VSKIVNFLRGNAAATRRFDLATQFRVHLFEMILKVLCRSSDHILVLVEGGPCDQGTACICQLSTI
jgi:hypothetical protein